ncbi:MAG: hypothetical protein RI601_12670, partial [Desulfurivibrionaceae bacterium]|nr:hypothetical protein [Desulfurivibrionaceae bacterium]
MYCLDFHTHIFPDHLAPTTLAALAQAGNVRPAADGTAAGLLAVDEIYSAEQLVIDHDIVQHVA